MRGELDEGEDALQRRSQPSRSSEYRLARDSDARADRQEIVDERADATEKKTTFSVRRRVVLKHAGRDGHRDEHVCDERSRQELDERHGCAGANTDDSERGK